MSRRQVLIAFHWSTVLLIGASFSIAWLHDGIVDLDRRLFWLDVHRSLGLVILVVTVVRLSQRAVLRRQPQSPKLGPPVWLASRISHALLYAGLIAMPVIGWAQSSARSRHLAIFGQPLPRLVKHNPELADTLGWWHQEVGWALLGLIVLHVTAALVHHFIFKDDTLKAMLAVSLGEGDREWEQS